MKVEHGAINNGISVQLHPNCFEDEAHVNWDGFEHALNHLVHASQLINGHYGLNFGVHARGHPSDLDGHKFTGDKSHPVGRSNLAGGSKGGHDGRKGRMSS
jgi:hypothetical protein